MKPGGAKTALLYPEDGMNANAPNNRTSNLPLAMIGLGVLLLIGALVVTTIQSSEHTGQAAAQSTSTQNIPEPQVKRVSLADAKAAFDSKAAVFVDVRDPDSYKAGHIPGAVNIPVEEIQTRYKELDASRWIITYCT